MRLVIIGLALGLAVPAAASAQGISLAAAPSPVSTQPLAAGEVLLEVNAMGNVTTRADTAMLVVTFNVSGATDAAARRAAEGTADRIAALASSFGVAAGDINRRPLNVGDEAAMAMAIRDMQRASEAAQRAANGRRPATLVPGPSAAPEGVSAHGEVEIKLRGLDRLAQLQHALEAAGLDGMTGPTYSLSDDHAAHAEARAQAITQARANAEAYASALNMRVVRIVRVTERVGMDFLGTMFSEGSRMRQMMSGMEGRSQDIRTTVALGMDFALAPR